MKTSPSLFGALVAATPPRLHGEDPAGAPIGQSAAIVGLTSIGSGSGACINQGESFSLLSAQAAPPTARAGGAARNVSQPTASQRVCRALPLEAA